ITDKTASLEPNVILCEVGAGPKSQTGIREPPGELNGLIIKETAKLHENSGEQDTEHEAVNRAQAGEQKKPAKNNKNQLMYRERVKRKAGQAGKGNPVEVRNS
ncbi:hypothetical protein CHARACLAT_028423, partial [Characodon lateralis]|nr:hypothetical protein [Characodon lateralis]